MDIELKKILKKVENNELKPDEAQKEITKLINNNYIRQDYGKIDYDGIYEKIESAFHMGTLMVCPQCGEIITPYWENNEDGNWISQKYKCDNCNWNGFPAEINYKTVKDSVIEILITEFLE